MAAVQSEIPRDAGNEPGSRTSSVPLGEGFLETLKHRQHQSTLTGKRMMEFTMGVRSGRLLTNLASGDFGAWGKRRMKRRQGRRAREV
jgi:hypothetical protein